MRDLKGPAGLLHSSASARLERAVCIGVVVAVALQVEGDGVGGHLSSKGVWARVKRVAPGGRTLSLPASPDALAVATGMEILLPLYQPNCRLQCPGSPHFPVRTVLMFQLCFGWQRS